MNRRAQQAVSGCTGSPHLFWQLVRTVPNTIRGPDAPAPAVNRAPASIRRGTACAAVAVITWLGAQWAVGTSLRACRGICPGRLRPPDVTTLAPDRRNCRFCSEARCSIHSSDAAQDYAVAIQSRPRRCPASAWRGWETGCGYFRQTASDDLGESCRYLDRQIVPSGGCSPRSWSSSKAASAALRSCRISCYQAPWLCRLPLRNTTI